MTRDADRCPDREPDPDRELSSDSAPDRACARDWQPGDAPEHRREPKREDEPVQWASEVATDTSDLDPDPEPGPQPELDADPHRERSRNNPAARAHDTHERDHAAGQVGGAVEPDGGGRHG